MPLLFFVLSLISLNFKADRSAWVGLVLLFFVYLTFKFLSLRYTARVTGIISESLAKAKVIRDGSLVSVDIS